ncbi:hypothetical protein LTR97_000025 [Elasticomyces elasticus]|uniref:Uncharacterized protein n=1 Tax=Elasticomyces elasticus TaxID=574655 RepID=A0AAN7WQX3_9PEZI|nr:hypothetical protein LTR97_000025 [Elasticomyces elasticus]
MCPPQHPADDAYTSNPLIAAHFSLTPPLTKIPSDHIYGSQSTFICTKIRALYAKHNLRNNRHYGLYYAGSNVTRDRNGQHERVMLLVLELSSEDIKAGKWRDWSLEDECKSILVQAQGGNPDVLRGVCLRFYCRRAEDDKDDPNLTLEVSSVYQLERTPRFNFRAMEREPVWLRSAREPVQRTDFEVGQIWDVGWESVPESEDEVGAPNRAIPSRRLRLFPGEPSPSISVRDTGASFRSNVRARQAADYTRTPLLSTAEDLESAMSSTDPSRNTSPAPPEPMSLAIRANSRSFWDQNLSRRNSSAVRPRTPSVGAGLVDSIVFASLEEAPIDPISTDLLSTRQELPNFNGETYSLTSTSEPPAATRSGSVNWWDTVDMNEAYPRESFTGRQNHQALSDIILGRWHTEAPAADSVSNASSASLSARVARHQSRGATIPDERGGRRHAVRRVRVSSWNLPSNEEIDAEREAYESRSQHAVPSNSDGVATAGSGSGELSGGDSESEAAKESGHGEVAQLSRARVIIDPTRDPSTTASVFAPENRPGAPPPVRQTR